MHQTKDRVTRSCSISGTHCINLVTNPLINYELGKELVVFTTSGTYPWSFVRHIFRNGLRADGHDSKFAK